MKRWLSGRIWIVTCLMLMLAWASPVLAHEGPDEGAEWLMADWMLLSFLIFFAVALLIFLFAVKRGYLSNLEDAKYHILTIDEPDYYTPEWAREGPSLPTPENVGGNGAPV